jgi:WD40 repeat protein
VATGKLAANWQGGEDDPSSLVFLAEGKELVTITSTRERIHWDVQTGKAKRTHAGRDESGYGPGRLVASADGKRYGVCTPHGALIWDAAGGEEVSSCSWKVRGWGSVPSHDLRLVAVPNHQDVDLRDARTGKLVRSLLDHRGRVDRVAFSGDDRLLAVAYSRFEDGAYPAGLCLWDVASGKLLRETDLDDFPCHHIDFSPVGGVVALGGTAGFHGPEEIRLFDAEKGGELARLRLPPRERLETMRFSPDGKVFAVAFRGGAVRLWDVSPRRAK